MISRSSPILRKSLSDRIRDKSALVLDGGLASEIEFLGGDIKNNLWSASILLHQPRLISTVHEAYLHAGADVILTSSYQATVPGLIKYTQAHLSEQDASDLIQKSVTLARDAVETHWKRKEEPMEGLQKFKPLVAGSIGCYGAWLADGSEYKGNYGLTKDQLKKFHRTQATLLVEAGADVLFFETVPSQLEAEAIAELMQTDDQLRAIEAVISFSCKDAEHICEGSLFSDAVASLSPFSGSIVGVGINCTSPSYISSLLDSAKPYLGKDQHFVVYPNSGEIYDPKSMTWSLPEAGSLHFHYSAAKEDSNSAFWKLLTEWLDRGTRVIGGCCRTRPTDILGIRKFIDSSV